MNLGYGARITVSLAAFLALVGLAYLTPTYLDWREWMVGGGAPKRYARDLAEGVAMQVGARDGVYHVSCERVHVEKRKKGALTFGAFNELVLDGLSVVIPPKREIREDVPEGTEETSSESDRVQDTLNRLGVVRGTLPGFGSNLRVSGLRINGLTISRLVGKAKVETCLTARKAELGSHGLQAHG